MHKEEKASGWYWFDTVVLSNFALAEALDWLGNRYKGKGVVTYQVFDEISLGVSIGYSCLKTIDTLIKNDIFLKIELSIGETQTYRGIRNRLGAGEASCIVAAISRGGTVVTDDRAARTTCVEESIPYTGTIGILKAGCKDQSLKLEMAEELLQKMKASGFYTPVNRLADVLG